MTRQDETHNERLLEAAGYRYDPETESWRDPDRNRALAAAMARIMTQHDLRRWIVAGRGRSAYGVPPKLRGRSATS